MTEELNHGDTAWLRVKIESPNETIEGNRVVSFLMQHATGEFTRSDILASVLDLKPYCILPSEHSETAELGRKVVEAARVVVTSWYDFGEVERVRSDPVGSVGGGEELIAAVEALDAALAPPSLEESIKEVVEVQLTMPYKVTDDLS